MVDTDRGRIVAVNLAPLLSGFNVGPYLEGRFGLPGWSITIPGALLVGDRWFRAGARPANLRGDLHGRCSRRLANLDGHLYRGPAGAGGWIGHTFVQVDGETCRCGRPRLLGDDRDPTGWLSARLLAWVCPAPKR